MQRPVFYAIAIIITAYLPIFTLQRVEGRLFKPMAWTVAFALLGRADLFHADRAGALQPCSSARESASGTTRCMAFLTDRYRQAVRWAIEHRCVTVGVGVAGLVPGRLSDLQRRDRFRIPAASG